MYVLLSAKWTDEDITKTLSKLGYEELSSKESTPFWNIY